MLGLPASYYGLAAATCPLRQSRVPVPLRSTVVARALCAVDDRLIGQNLKFLADVQVIVWTDLSHHDPYHLFCWIDPEVRAEGPSPTVLPDRARDPRRANVFDYAIPEPESITRAGQPHRKVSDVVRSHQLHRFAAKYADAVQFASAQHHLMKSEVIRRRRHKSSSTGEKNVRLFDPAALYCWRFDELDLVSLARRILSREAADL